MISRRRVLQVAAATPALLLLPGFGPSALAAEGPVVGATGATVDGTGLAGLSLSWRGDPHAGPVAQIRVLLDGAWSEPISVEADHDHGPPDPDGRLHGPAVLYTGATAYAITPVGGATDLRRHDIPLTRGPVQLQADGLGTVEPLPGLAIITRDNWTTRGRKDTIDCTILSSVYGLGCRTDVSLRHGVIHHTVNDNGYSTSAVPSLLRGIQRYHMDTRGWDDIAYNFVIDRFGRIWHARDGALDQPIVGGHTLGFNTESVGVAVLGTFTSSGPPQAVVDSLGLLLGWKLGLHGVDPLGTTIVRSSGGDRTEPGDMVLVNNIDGHRGHQQTSCPGRAFSDSTIVGIRHAAAELVPVFGFLDATFRPEEVAVEGWSIDRLQPDRAVLIDVTVDGGTPTLLAADQPHTDRGDHAFSHTSPIDLDTRSIVVTAHAGDGRSAKLMDLKLFATFIDVEPDRFFAEGVYWMRSTELSFGTRPGLFEPMDEMNRAQMATFLWRFMDSPPPSSDVPFTDLQPGSFYDDAVRWLHGTGITTGITPTRFGPDNPVTRGQMATFLWRLCGEQSAPPSPFTDVPTGSFYEQAVHWMAHVGITTGKTPSLFAPEATVTRGEMAAFLQRLATTAEAWTVTPPPSVVEI